MIRFSLKIRETFGKVASRTTQLRTNANDRAVPAKIRQSFEFRVHVPWDFHMQSVPHARELEMTNGPRRFIDAAHL
jgi:hypothetical protein